jgi:arginine repressor
MVKCRGRPSVGIPSTLLSSLYQQGLSERAICDRLKANGIHTSQATVHQRLQALKVAGNKKKAATRKLDDRARRALSRLIRVAGIRTCPQLQKAMAERGIVVSRSTILRALKENSNLQLQRPRRRPFMSHVQQESRLQWAKTVNYNWNSVFYGDETSGIHHLCCLAVANSSRWLQCLVASHVVEYPI